MNTHNHIWETRQTWDQACWRESGSRGVYTLAPLPWVTLLLSFCALMSLLPPLSPLPHSPPTPVPTQVIPPLPLPSVAPSTSFSSSDGAQPIRQKTLPQARGPKESLAPLVSTEKLPLAAAAVYARPCPLHSQKGGTLKTMTHTGEVPRQLPVAPHGHQQGFKLLGLKHVLSCFLFSSFYFCCMSTLHSFNATCRERSDIRTIQSMAAYGVFFPRSRPSDPEIVLPIEGPRDTAILPSCVFRGRLFRQGF